MDGGNLGRFRNSGISKWAKAGGDLDILFIMILFVDNISLNISKQDEII
jgi:hypothetical protein